MNINLYKIRNEFKSVSYGCWVNLNVKIFSW